MITETMAALAAKKLAEERETGKFDRYGNAMKDKVCEKLTDFCRQDEEFAQAVVQGGTFSECMAAVAKGIGSSISDEEAYGRAVQFYFPGAAVHVQMTVDLAPHSHDEDTDRAPRKAVTLNLADFW